MNRLFKIFFIIIFSFFVKADFAIAQEVSHVKQCQIISINHNENVVRRSKNNATVISNLINIGINKYSKRNNFFVDFDFELDTINNLYLTQAIKNKDFCLDDKYLKNQISYEILPNAP